MDLRLYVVVTSFDPLVVYLHEQGLVRLAAQTYDTSHNSSPSSQNLSTACVDGSYNNSKNTNSGDTFHGNGAQSRHKSHFDVYRHLTNYSVGRKFAHATLPALEEEE
uniref:Tubulin polyglutamylase TTLL5 n=1 Tax=Lygus hesperus TaxID=30085 RepID=A0A0A9Y0R7_LYGHE